MREFLADMLLMEQLESVLGLGLLPVLSSGSCPRLREVLTLYRGFLVF